MQYHHLFWSLCVAAACLVSVLMAGVIIPKILLIAFRKRLFDVPNERKIHTSAVPRLGGIAFLPVTMFSVALVVGLGSLLDSTISEAFDCGGLRYALVLCATLLLYLVGVADDLIGVRYRAKFVIQILCGLLLVGSGVALGELGGMFGISHLPPAASLPLTVLIVIFVVNAINLIDGIDGLASGLCMIALVYYGFLFLEREQYLLALVAFSLLGTVVPFYYYNVFGSPEHGKKIFMGDTGSLTLGFMLVFLSLSVACGTQTGAYGCNTFVLAFAPLVIPCFDVVRVFAGRLMRHRDPFLPDNTHIHHRLMAMGLGQRSVMVSVILAAVLLTAVNVIMSCYVNVNIVFLLNAALYVAVNVVISKRTNQESKI